MNTQNVKQSVENEVPVAPPFPDAFEEAYQRRLTEIRAVSEKELFATNLDIHSTIATVLGALPEIRALRAEMARVPQLDQALLDGLEDYAKATGEANSLYTTAIAPRQDIVPLNEAAVKEREQLRIDAQALASRGLIDPGRLTGFTGLLGYKNVAFELIDYANLLRDSWAAITGKTALTLEEIHDAKTLGMRLVEAAGLREQAPVVAAEAAKIRQQALTLLVKAYDEVRRAVLFLRWREEDADTIAPSLYAGRGGKKRTDPAAPEAPATPAAPPAGATAVPPPAPVHTAAVPVGMPGANPFT